MAYGPPPDPTNVMGRRIFAWIIDAVPAIVIGFVIVFHSLTRVDGVTVSTYCDNYRALHGSGALCFQSGSTAYYGPSSFRGSSLLISLIYWFAVAGVLQGLTGASLGKHVMGLRVVDANGALLNMGQALLRTFIGIFEIGFCFLVALVTASVTHPHRRLGDYAAGTFVVPKEAVGHPIGSAATAGYPPPWTPPGAQTWGPPPAGGGQPWGAPPPAWGAPPPASAPPQTWGPPPAGAPVQQPPAQAPTTWGSPAPVPDDPPASTSTPTPAPVDQPVQQPAPQAAQPAPSPEPQWDAQRNAWVYWEAETSRWLQHDPVTGQWGPLR